MLNSWEGNKSLSECFKVRICFIRKYLLYYEREELGKIDGPKLFAN